LLSLLLGQQTNLQPKEIMTDMGAYSDVMFALFWVLGFQFSPRISDVGGARFWRIDPTADYDALNGLARRKINLGLIAEHRRVSRAGRGYRTLVAVGVRAPELSWSLQLCAPGGD
jgi:TnpA family transposase